MTRRGQHSSVEKSSAQWNPKHQHQQQNEETQWPRSWWIVYCGSRCHKRKTFSLRSPLVHFLKTLKLVIRVIIKRQKSDDEIRVVDTQSCAGLFDKISLDPKIQIKHVDTKNQLADMLTNGNFSRDEWNHFLRLFNIMNLSMFSCGHFPSIENPKTVSKRSMQKQNEEKNPCWRNQSQWVWYRKAQARIDLRCWIWVYHTARGIVECQVVIQILQASRNRGEMWINAQAARNLWRKNKNDSQRQGSPITI